MIPRSPYIAVLCVGLAGALHAAVATLPAPAAERTAIAGGGAASIATLGDSFADMAEGASVPEPQKATTADPAKAAVPVPQALKLAAFAPPRDSAAPAPERAEPATPTLAAASAPVERVEAEPAAPAPKPKARPAPKQHATPAPKKSGNAAQNARAGQASGQKQAPRQHSGPAQGAATQAGNAAAANYPGQVMRRIQRTRRERVNVRGTAQVRFTIAANGTLAALDIARSSGSPHLDRVALQQIRRAAPFAPPPTGARRSFTLRIDGK